jgi:hypothetical protein
MSMYKCAYLLADVFLQNDICNKSHCHSAAILARALLFSPETVLKECPFRIVADQMEEEMLSIFIPASYSSKTLREDLFLMYSLNSSLYTNVKVFVSHVEGRISVWAYDCQR